MKIIAFLLIFSFVRFNLNAQNIANDLWTKTTNLKSISTDVLKRESVPAKFEIYNLNLSLLKERLKNVPNRDNLSEELKVIISFPNNEGILENFQIMETSLMESELQEEYPDIRSYIGNGIENPGSIVRFSITPLGLNGLLLSNTNSDVLIDPYTLDRLNYMVYSRNDNFDLKTSLENDIIDNGHNNEIKNLKSEEFRGVIDGKLRTFRLAFAVKGEMSESILSSYEIPKNVSDEYKKGIILSNLITSITRVNAVFERDVCLTLKLVANNTSVIFLDPSNDGYSDDNDNWLKENQINCDSLIGTTNYDIGHLLSFGSGELGMGLLHCVCSDYKATGYSKSLEDWVLLHEMGHQFGANHTFNIPGYIISASVEPMAGYSIMSYAYGGVKLFFHSISIQEIWNHITVGEGQCASITETGNVAPTIYAGNNQIIPKSTPFVLEGQATDPNGNLTYSWEQNDPELNYPPISTSTGGPVFKFVSPSLSPNRYLPEMTTIISGSLDSLLEIVPSVSRVLNFNFVVRDNDPRGGQIAIDKKVVKVDGNSGPFMITSNKTQDTWYEGSTQTITWDVAGTNEGAINALTVDILLSTDGGFTYPIQLVSNVSNDGSQDIVVPFNSKTKKGRYMIRAVDNIFFAINRANLTIEEPFLVNFNNATIDVCLPDSTATFDFTYKTYLDTGTVAFSAKSPPGIFVTFNPSSTNKNETSVKMMISGISEANIGKNTVTLVGTSFKYPEKKIETMCILNVYSSDKDLLFKSVTPQNGAKNVLPDFRIGMNTNFLGIQIGTGLNEAGDLINLVDNQYINTNSYKSSSLKFKTKYYWRFLHSNPCHSALSPNYSFTTIVVDSFTYIPDNQFWQALIDLKIDSGYFSNYVKTSNIENIQELNIQNRNISDLTGIQNFAGLISLDCSHNQLTNIDISKNTALKDLCLDSNQLASVDVLKNTALSQLSISNNHLTNIDVSKNTLLKHLWLDNNQLTSIDVSKNIELEVLKCQRNLLTSIDLLENIRVIYLDLAYNNLTSLNFQNGKNNLIEFFNAFFNPFLNCIQVDNASESSNNINWNEDVTAIYSEDCQDFNVNVSTLSFPFFKVYPNPTTEIINIEFPQNNGNKIEFSVLNLVGTEVFRKELDNAPSYQIDLSNQVSGIYFLKVIVDNRQYISKIVVSR